MNLFPSFFMLATLFFNAGGTFTKPDTKKITLNEGVRVEIPCVQSVLHFEQIISGESLIPKNWGIRVSSAGVAQNLRNGTDDDIDNSSEPDEFKIFDEDDESDDFYDTDKTATSLKTEYFPEIGCEFALGRINIQGPVSALKNPMPGFKKKWSTKSISSIQLKSNLPTAKTGKKPLSALVSLDFGTFFAGFAAIGLDASDTGNGLHDTQAESTDTNEESTTSDNLVCTDNNPAPKLGAESFLFQLSFAPESRNGFRFFLGSTLSVAQFSGTKSSKLYSIKTFRQTDCLMNLLNMTQFSKTWGNTTLSVQDSFSAGLSHYKNGIAFCNEALLSLSGKGFSLCAGCFCADFGYITSSGTEILDPLSIYGSAALSFKIDGAKVNVNVSCIMNKSYDEEIPHETASDNGAIKVSEVCGLSVSKGQFFFSAENSMKNICRKDNFADTLCCFSVKVGFGGSSLQLNTKSPLFANSGLPEWGVTFNISSGKENKLSGSVSGKFKGMEFSTLKGNMSFSCGFMKITASGSISMAQKITWSLSAQINL